MSNGHAKHAGPVQGRRRATWRYAVVAIAAIALVPLLSAGFQAADDGGASRADAVVPPGAVSFADVVERVSPAVVNIAVTKRTRSMPTAVWPDRVPRGGEFEQFSGGFSIRPAARRTGRGSRARSAAQAPAS